MAGNRGGGDGVVVKRGARRRARPVLLRHLENLDVSTAHVFFVELESAGGIGLRAEHQPANGVQRQVLMNRSIK